MYIWAGATPVPQRVVRVSMALVICIAVLVDTFETERLRSIAIPEAKVSVSLSRLPP